MKCLKCQMTISDISDNYQIFINDFDLKQMNMRYSQIKTISLKLKLLSMENDSADAQSQEVDGYYDIEL